MALRLLPQPAKRESELLRILLALLPRSLIREGIMVDQHIREGRFQRSLSLMAGLSNILGGLEVLTEHYRGSYSQRVMYTPVLLSPALLIAGAWGALSRSAARTVLPIVSLLQIADGIVGFVFHIRGVHRKPGGWRIPIFNIIMGPPLFAPLLLTLSGFLGVLASLLRREDDPARSWLPGAPRRRATWRNVLPRAIRRDELALEQDIREGRFQRGVAAATALLALFNGIEALYSHYKNNFTYRSEWLPILMTPVIAGAGIGAVWSRTIARTLLPVASVATTITGGLGFFYHARGVTRRPGGMKTPIYNIIFGPPIFAPLLFAATGMLGVLASLLRRGD